MGDIADDVWNAAWDMQEDIQAAIRALARDCERCKGNPTVKWNDDGLIECARCGRATDI